MPTLLDETIKRFKIGSTTKARKLIKSGAIQVNGAQISRPDHICQPMDQITLATKSERQLSKLPFEVLFNDEFIIIVNKPSGITSEDFHEKLKQSLGKAYLTHRLDREVSGVMIFAKSFEIEKQLELGWRSNTKLYMAITEGIPSKAKDTLESWLSETKDLRVYSGSKSGDAKHAITHYRVLQTKGNQALIEVRLETGRKHQIRVHMSDMNCPIVGDIKYGSKTNMKGRIALHAFKLALNHPVTQKRIEATAPLPLFFSTFSIEANKQVQH